MNLEFLKDKYFLVFSFLYLFITLFSPPNFATFNSHDAGSQAAFEYWLINNVQFGVDIVQNVGPYGFINYPQIYTGFLDIPKFLINLLLLFFLIALILLRLKNFISPLKWFLIILISLLAKNDSYYFFICFMILDFFVTNFLTKSKNQRSKIENFIAFISIIILALLSLTKGTLLFICISSLATIVTFYVHKEGYKKGFFVILFYSLSLFLFWVLAGQKLPGLIEFLQGMIGFSSGYIFAMTKYEPLIYTLFGIIFLAFAYYAQRSYLNSFHFKKKLPKVIYQLNLFFFIFVAWKHGFVRGDHVSHFFYFIYLLIVFIFCIPLKINNKPITKKINYSHLFIIIFGLIIVFKVGHTPRFATNLVPSFIENIKYNFAFLSDPLEKVKRLQEELKINIDEMSFKSNYEHKIDEAIYFGNNPSLMLYNKWLYMPTPSTVSFASWSFSIAKKNQLFLNKTDSQFIFMNLNTIDNRLLAQDDSLSQVEVIRKYTPIDIYNESILLKKINNKNSYKWGSIKKRVAKKTLNLGDWISIESFNHYYVWCNISLKQSYLSRILSFLYKPESYKIEVEYTDGSLKDWKFIPKMAEYGFLVNPLIAENLDFINLYHNSSDELKIKRFRILQDKFKFASASSGQLELSIFE